MAHAVQILLLIILLHTQTLLLCHLVLVDVRPETNAYYLLFIYFI